jgi:hypothetical protein
MARRKTLFELMVKRVGIRKTRKVMGFMVAWAIVEQSVGAEPSIEEYAAWWKQSAATTFREQALFRECFPEETSPSRLMNAPQAKTAEGDTAAFHLMPAPARFA